MFSLFKKKPGPNEIFAEGPWLISQGTDGETPIIVRRNTNLEPFAGETTLTLKIGFAIPLNAPNPGGMPDADENEAIGNIEDKIFEELRASGPSVFALAISTGTYKEFVFYAEPGLDIKSVHEGLMKDIKSHEIQCYAEMDPDWETYKEYAT